jgi:hypothetical protein
MPSFENDGYYGSDNTTLAPFPAGINPNGKITGIGATAAARTSAYAGYPLIQSKTYTNRSALTSTVVSNVTATPLTLTAGIWDIGGAVGVLNNGSTPTDITICAIGQTSATIPTNLDTLGIWTNNEIYCAMNINALSNGNNIAVLPIPVATILVTNETIFYLLCRAVWTTNTMYVWGSIWATARI